MMLGVVVTLSARRQAWESYIPAAPPWPRTGDTGLTLADLWALRGKDGADRVVARAILSGADSVPATGEHFAWGWRWPIAHSSRQIMGLWPHSVFDGHAWDIHPLDGSENSAWTRTRWAAQFTRGNFVIFRKEVGGLDRFRQYTLSLSPMSWCLLGLLGAWLAPAIPIRLTMWHRRRRDRRRVARGQCVRCGYEGVRPARLAAASPARG